MVLLLCITICFLLLSAYTYNLGSDKFRTEIRPFLLRLTKETDRYKDTDTHTHVLIY